MNATQKYTRPLYVLFGLQALVVLRFLIQLLGNVFSFSPGSELFTWLGNGLTVAAAVCLLILPNCSRLGGMLMIWALIVELVPLLPLHLNFPAMTADDLRTVSTVCYWVSLALNLAALFCVFSGYGHLAPSVAKAWNILFGAQLAIAVVGLAASFLLGDTLTNLVESGALWVMTLSGILSGLLSLALGTAHLLLLYRTADAVRKEK